MKSEMGCFFARQPEWKERIMLIEEGGQKVSYGDFEAFVCRREHVLQSRTILFLLGGNQIGAVFSYLLALRKQVVPLLLDAEIGAEALCDLKKRYQPEYVVVPSDSFLERKQSDENDAEEFLFEEYGYAWFAQKQADKAVVSRKLSPDLALLLSTSGSTGSPKLVRQSYQNIMSNAASIAGYLELSSSERPITVLPMHYTYGLSVIHSHLLVGAALLLTKRSVVEQEFWDFFRKEGATSISGVPYTYKILKQLHLERMDLPSLKTMTQAGGKLSEELQAFFASYAKENGKKWIVMYGQTEATARMSYLPEQYSQEKIGSIGIAIPGGRFWLRDEDGKEINEVRTVGELIYEGKNVTQGYAVERSDLEKGDERNGILFTGDMAWRDEDGFYYIAGRKKRFLKLFGNRINLDEIEQKLNQRFAPLECVCVGEDDRMEIYVQGEKKESEPILEWMEQNLKLNRKGYQIFTVRKLPRNEAGKLLYGELQILKP